MEDLFSSDHASMRVRWTSADLLATSCEGAEVAPGGRRMQETPPIPGVSIRRRLAVGGMGELFLADEELADGTKRPCVVKRLLPGAGHEEQRLIAREAMALAALTRADAPHVVKLYRSGPDWLLLEWVAGVDLAALLEHRRRRGRPLPAGVALALAVGLARGLEALALAIGEDGARLGLVHRDVHPGNVLLGLDGTVKLADLGVVALASAPTMAGLKGTLVWMAPEQLARGATSPASDVYSAGLIAYEAFTGQLARPVGNLGLAELLAARSALPTAPGVLRPELAEALAAALLAPLAVDPAQRPTASQWIEQLLAAALPVTPDPVALAALVAEVQERSPVALAQRTYVAPSAPAAASEVARPVAAPAKRTLRWLGAAALISGGGAAVWAIASSFSVVPPVRESSLGAPDVASAALPDATETKLTEVVASIQVSARDSHLDELAGPDPLASPGDSTLIEATFEDTQARRPRDTEAPRDIAAVTSEGAHRIRISATDGPVHVRGGGKGGLAPWSSDLLAEGDSMPLHITGGARPLTAVVRVRNRKNAGLTASIGAVEGMVYDVSCAGRAKQQTPVFGIDVSAGGVPCRLEASDGRTMAFVLVDVAE